MDRSTNLQQNQIVVGTSRGATTIDTQKLLTKSWYKYPHLRRLYGWLLVILIVQATNGFDGSLMNGLQSLTYWQHYFHNPTGAQLGVFNGTQGLGSVFSATFLWYLIPLIGRKWTIIIGSLIITLGVFLQSFAHNLPMFAAARGIIGMGLSFEYNAAPMLVNELAHPKHRAQISTLLNTIYYVGATLAAWVTLGTLSIQSDWSWRSVSLLQMFPSLISLSLTWFVPESPRWLVSKGRREKAMKILVDYHCGGDASDPLAEFEMHEIEETLAYEKQHSRGWVDLIHTRGNRWRTWIVASCAIGSQSCGSALVGYYLVVILKGVGITNPQHQNIINGCLTMWQMGFAFWGASVIDKNGRRPMMLYSLTGMLIFGMIPWTICNAVYATRGDKGAGYAVLAFIFIFQGFYSTTWNGILTGYTVEITSMHIRAKLTCIQALLVQGILTMWGYVNPIALDALDWKYYIIYCAIIVGMITLVYFTYPETARITLEEISIIFDGENAVKNDIFEQKVVGGEPMPMSENKKGASAYVEDTGAEISD